MWLSKKQYQILKEGVYTKDGELFCYNLNDIPFDVYLKIKKLHKKADLCYCLEMTLKKESVEYKKKLYEKKRKVFDEMNMTGINLYDMISHNPLFFENND